MSRSAVVPGCAVYQASFAAVFVLASANEKPAPAYAAFSTLS